MLRDFYTILKLCDEFRRLIGMKLVEIFSQDKDTAILVFYDGANKYLLYISTNFLHASCYLDNSFTRAKNNSIDIFPELLGEVLQEVSIFNNDRIIEFNFINHNAYLTLFGGANSNLFICDKKQRILNSLDNSEKYKNTTLEFTNQNLPKVQLESEKISLNELLKTSNYKLNKNYISQFLYKENISAEQKYSISELANTTSKINNFISEILSSKNFYVLENSPKEVIFSLIPLANHKIIAEFDDINKGVKKAQILKIITAKKLAISREILPKLKREEKKILENISIIENSDKLLELSNNYKYYAELLLSQPELKSKFGDVINIPDWSGKLIFIKLDPKLNLLDNAQKYYKKSKKILTDIEIKQKRLPKLKERLDKIQTEIFNINNAVTLKEITNIRNELSEKTLINMQNEERSIESKFRRFNLGEGYILYVGKNAANNDELTMKFAKPNDFWLHARGSSGSHCVLKLESANKTSDKVPKNILKTAAEIAAYYSGSKNAKYTPVCYTQKKYIRKPKGANVGAVVLQREEVIMVEPKLPELLD